MNKCIYSANVIQETDEKKFLNKELYNDLKLSKTDYHGMTHGSLSKRLQVDYEDLYFKLEKINLVECTTIGAIKNTVYGYSRDMYIKGQTIHNINPISMINCSSVATFTHNGEGVTIEMVEGSVKATQPLVGQHLKVGYQNTDLLQPDAFYYAVADIEFIQNTNNVPYAIQVANGSVKQNNTLTAGRGLLTGVFKSPTKEALNQADAKWIGVSSVTNTNIASNDSFKLHSFSVYSITQQEYDKGHDVLSKRFPYKSNSLHSVGTSEDSNVIIVSQNKNLIDFNGFEIGDISAVSGQNTGHGGRSRTKDFIPIQPGNYVLSKNVSEWFYVGAYDKNKKYIRYLVDAKSNKGTFTITSDMAYIRIRLNNHIDTLSGLEIQLEEGSSPTNYVLMEKQKRVIKTSEPLRSIPSGAFDNLEHPKGHILHHKRIGEYIFNGKEDWQLVSTDANTLHLSTNVVENVASNIGVNDFVSNLLCSSATSSEDNPCISIEGSVVHVRILKSKLSSEDLNGFKSYLSANNLQLLYKLQTTVVTELVDSTDINIICFPTITYVSSENIVKPLLTFKVPTNTGAVLTSLIEENKYLSKMVSKLQYSNDLLNNGHVLQGQEIELANEAIDFLMLGKMNVKKMLKTGGEMKMGAYIASRIIKKGRVNISEGQRYYRQYLSMPEYAEFKGEVDLILISESMEHLIVEI